MAAVAIGGLFGVGVKNLQGLLEFNHSRGDRDFARGTDVADSLDDLESQLNALMADPNVAAATGKKPAAPQTPPSAAANASVAPSPVPAVAAQSAQSVQSASPSQVQTVPEKSGAEDIAGLELADQIQKLLDDAAEQAVAAQAMPKPAPVSTVAQSPAPAASPAPASAQAAPSVVGAPEPDSAQTIQQIDQMLARNAAAAEQDLELQGDFETPEQAQSAAASPVASSGAAPATPASTPVVEKTGSAAADPTTAPVAQSAATVNQELDDLLDGSFETPEQAAAATPAPAPAPIAAAAPTASMQPATAAAVAAEIDADERLSPRSMKFPASGSAVAPAADTIPAIPPAPRGPSILVRLLAPLNAPLARRPAWQRDLVGFIGLETFCVGLALLAKALGGSTAMLIAIACSAALLGAAFYFMFLRPSHSPPAAV